EPIDFPGYRKMYACYIGHPEPITLNRTLKARNICNLMFIGKKPTDLTRKYAEKVENKELSIKEAIIQLNKKFNRLILISVIFIWKLIREYSNGPPTICAIATGIKEGKKKKIGVGIYNLPYGYMAGITGVPLAIAVLMMIDGKITKKGILTPEEAIEPIEFFNRLAKYCGRNLKGKDILIMREENLDD
ncbi:MAG: saccharopine dehydrogenase C-terminal domain-containing protein, partial [Promethearchaeota archaeon]